jgi:hypothetical protein
MRAQNDPRWEYVWSPIRWTEKYRHNDHKYVSYWALDSFSLAVMLEELDKDNTNSVLRETAALLKNDPRSISVVDAVSRLARVGDLLEKWDSGLK